MHLSCLLSERSLSTLSFTVIRMRKHKVRSLRFLARQLQVHALGYVFLCVPRVSMKSGELTWSFLVKGVLSSVSFPMTRIFKLASLEWLPLMPSSSVQSSDKKHYFRSFSSNQSKRRKTFRDSIFLNNLQISDMAAAGQKSSWRTRRKTDRPPGSVII